MFHTVLLLACDASLVGMAGRKCSLSFVPLSCVLFVCCCVCCCVFLACCRSVVVVVVRAGGAVCVWLWWAY